MSYRYRGRIYTNLELTDSNALTLSNNDIIINHTGSGSFGINSNEINIGDGSSTVKINGVNPILPSTDYLEEGTTNLYFTEQRAIEAINNSSINIKDSAGDNLTSTSGSLNANITNTTTTNNKISGFPTNANIGLNMYVIPSKTQTFLFNAFTNNTNTNALIGSNTSVISFTALNWGRANPKTWYMKTVSGAATDIVITYTYIDTLGNEQTATAGPLSTVGLTLPNIITINKWKANKNLTTADVVQIMAAVNSGVNSFCGGSLYETNNSLFTCPNNAIAWVQSVQFSANVADNLRLLKWDVDGNRTTMFGWNGTANTQAYATGEYGFGGYITAGETIGWAGEISTTRKNVYSNIVCRYL